MSFISNPFMQVDTTCISEQLSEASDLKVWENLMFQKTIQLDLVDSKTKQLLTFAHLFGSTYLCKLALSDRNFIKRNHKNFSMVNHLDDSFRVAVSSPPPLCTGGLNAMSGFLIILEH